MTDSPETPKYKLRKAHWLQLRENEPTKFIPAGEVIEFDGIPSLQMEALNDEARRRLEERGRPPDPGRFHW